MEKQMTEPVITNSIPCPPPARRGRLAGGVTLYPVDKLEIGHSFGVPKAKRSSLQGTAYRIGKRTGRKFVVRVDHDASEARVWRIE
jgi:hypothetical protein